MKKALFASAIGALGAATLLLTTLGAPYAPAQKAQAAPAAGKHGPIPWTESLEKAQKTAAKQKKLVFVDFYAEWCGPCKEMLRTTYSDKKVVSRMKHFVPVLINVDKQPALARKYNVEAIPNAVFLDAKGNVVQRAVGYHDAAAFLKVADAAAKKNGSATRQAAH